MINSRSQVRHLIAKCNLSMRDRVDCPIWLRKFLIKQQQKEVKKHNQEREKGGRDGPRDKMVGPKVLPKE